jgi:uncharacterized protein
MLTSSLVVANPEAGEEAGSMRRRVVALAIALGFAAACALQDQRHTPVPSVPKRWATDNVGVLTPGVLAQLDARLEDYERRTGHQVILWIGQTTNREPHRMWTLRTFNSWGIGRAGKDDGVVLWFFVKDEMRWITVGWGLERAISDAEATRICREVIKPLVQRGHYDEAATVGIDAILAKIGRQ